MEFIVKPLTEKESIDMSKSSKFTHISSSVTLTPLIELGTSLKSYSKETSSFIATDDFI
jgi:hypothetical protein